MAMEPTAQGQEMPPQPLSAEQFAQDDPRQIYARMRPDQRTAIGEEFARCFRLSDDAEARDKYGAYLNGMLAPERVAEMHTYARERHPDIFEEVMHHPVTVASLEAPGAKAEAINPEQAAGTGAPIVRDIPSKLDRNVPPALP